MVYFRGLFMSSCTKMMNNLMLARPQIMLNLYSDSIIPYDLGSQHLISGGRMNITITEIYHIELNWITVYDIHIRIYHLEYQISIVHTNMNKDFYYSYSFLLLMVIKDILFVYLISRSHHCYIQREELSYCYDWIMNARFGMWCLHLPQLCPSITWSLSCITLPYERREGLFDSDDTEILFSINLTLYYCIYKYNSLHKIQIFVLYISISALK